MTVAYKTAASAGEYNPADSTLTVAAPGAISAGDVLVAVLFVTSGATTPPAGWVQAGGDGLTSGVCTGRVWTKVASGSEPATYDWAMSSTASAVLMLSAHSGVDTMLPVELLSWGGTATPSTAQVAPALTATTPGSQLLCAWGAVGGAGSYTPPGGMSEHGDLTTAWQFGSVCHESLAAAGATGTRTATCNSSKGYLSVSLLLAPAGPVTSDEVTVWIDPDGGQMPLATEWRTSGRFAPRAEFQEEGIPGQPGARLRDVLHAVREFVQPVWIVDSNETALRARLREMVLRMDPARGDGRVRVTGPGGDQREITCRVAAGLEMVETLGDTSGPNLQRAVLLFRAVDPYWSATSDVSDTFQPGAPTPFFPIFPIRLSASEVAVDASVDNTGDVQAWPVWTLVGPFTALIVRNFTTGRSLQLTTTLLAGESVTIDTRPGAKSVLKNDGTNLFPQLSNLSSLFPFERGSNSLRIEMTGASAGVSMAHLAWRPRFLSV